MKAVHFFFESQGDSLCVFDRHPVGVFKNGEGFSTNLPAELVQADVLLVLFSLDRERQPWEADLPQIAKHRAIFGVA